MMDIYLDGETAGSMAGRMAVRWVSPTAVLSAVDSAECSVSLMAKKTAGNLAETMVS